MSAGDQSGIASSVRTRTTDEKQALTRRILWSRCFEKSVRLRDFLSYVCNRASEDPAADIHEQEIGCAVFGRPADYDTSADNIVRVNASQVRKKLELYFATEGSSEPLVLTIPKGKYVPLFKDRTTTVLEPAVTAEFLERPTDQPPDGPLERPWGRRVVLCSAALSPILAVLCIWMAFASREPRASAKSERESNPNLTALWSQLVRPDNRTDIVVTDSSLGLIQDLIQRPIPLSEYVHPDQWAQASSLSAKPEVQAAARLAARRHYTSFANVNLARRILSMMGEDQSRVTVQFARDFGVRQMKYDNVILLGSKRANPWVELVENQMNFRFGYDGASRQSYFENRQPRQDEPKSYRNDEVVSYCRIAFMPNLEKTGNILVIAGTEMEGTEVGGEFLTSEKWMSNLRRVVPLDRTGRFPSFEVMLKASKVAGPASGLEIVAHRVSQ